MGKLYRRFRQKGEKRKKAGSFDPAFFPIMEAARLELASATSLKQASTSLVKDLVFPQLPPYDRLRVQAKHGVSPGTMLPCSDR